MSESPDEPILDQDVIDGLRALEAEGAPGLFGELVDLFLSDTPPRMQAMEDALESGDAQGVEAAAHSLKSSCGNVGAKVLAELFQEIEALGREAQLDSVPSLAARTRGEFDQVERALRNELS